MTVEAFAPAKINLTLHVTGQREDGYHLLDSLVVFADIGDRLTLDPAEDISLSVTGPRAEGVPVDGRNLVLKAAALFGPGQGAGIRLDKRLPAAAGIGEIG
ncbi:4-(cytidine 5'-diphospho)-2-C-methyl-D-erythritol kinase, partial [Rhodovulum sulfidophilum]|nr:4-(cytidine 5'-diphospho)-2-C-methyl-D-erythritol kinase [Rhodovulum sulfidophilum]